MEELCETVGRLKYAQELSIEIAELLLMVGNIYKGMGAS
jgi:hypothetical protein